MLIGITRPRMRSFDYAYGSVQDDTVGVTPSQERDGQSRELYKILNYEL